MTALSQAIEAFQALLEGHSHDPDDEILFEDLQKARSAMEAAWLDHVTGFGRVSA